jgi:hypothetical protein
MQLFPPGEYYTVRVRPMNALSCVQGQILVIYSIFFKSMDERERGGRSQEEKRRVKLCVLFVSKVNKRPSVGTSSCRIREQ